MGAIKDTTQNIPELRFPEYFINENEGYLLVFFEDLFNFSSGKNIKQNEASREFETPCVRYGELYHMYGAVITQITNKTNLERAELKFSDGDEILLPSAGEDPLDIGSASALTLKDIAIGRTINILKPRNPNVYCHRYVSYYINEKLRKSISKLARGASISNVYNSDLKRLKINLPDYLEQKKVTSFITLVENWIENLKQQQENLEAYKKGMTQKIFSQEIRFKDVGGKSFPDWEEKRLGEICSFFSGGTPTSTKKEYYIGTIPFIGSGDIFDSSVEKYISEDGFQNSSTKMVEEGDILYALYGANSGDVGISKLSGAINQAVLCIRTTQNKNFLYQLLFYKKESIIRKYLQGGQGNLSSQIIKNLKICFPSVEEQTRIAKFITSLDEQIEAKQSEIKKAEAWKKGLMQQMFT